MKKALTFGFCGIVLVVAAIVMWKWVLPFIGIVLKQIFEILAKLI